MTTNPYQQGTSTYQQVSDTNLGGMEIVLELYKGIIKFLKQAKSAYVEGDLEQMTYFMDRAFKVVEALYAHLDVEAGGKDADFLKEFYVVLIGRMGKILDRPDIPREFDQLVDYVTPVYEQWYVLTHGSSPLSSSDEESSDEISKAV